MVHRIAELGSTPRFIIHHVITIGHVNPHRWLNSKLAIPRSPTPSSADPAATQPGPAACPGRQVFGDTSGDADATTSDPAQCEQPGTSAARVSCAEGRGGQNTKP